MANRVMKYYDIAEVNSPTKIFKFGTNRSIMGPKNRFYQISMSAFFLNFVGIS